MVRSSSCTLAGNHAFLLRRSICVRPVCETAIASLLADLLFDVRVGAVATPHLFVKAVKGRIQDMVLLVEGAKHICHSLSDAMEMASTCPLGRVDLRIGLRCFSWA